MRRKSRARQRAITCAVFLPVTSPEKADRGMTGHFAQSSNSATMSTLLRLLEPSSSTSTASTNSSSTHAPTSTRSKPLVLVVDEFDLFAQHPRQSFLYCLLDIVQGNRRRGGVAVVGVSSRVVRPVSSSLACIRAVRNSVIDLAKKRRTGLPLAARETRALALPVARPPAHPAIVVLRLYGPRKAAPARGRARVGGEEGPGGARVGRDVECRGRGE